jgi:hypothetical protein
MSEIVWAAGFFDGEGSASVHWQGVRKDGTRRAYAQISVNQKALEPLYRFAAAVGYGNVSVATGDWCSGWFATGARAHEVMAMLWPWLSDPKRQQWAKVASVIAQNEPSRNSPKCDCGKCETCKTREYMRGYRARRRSLKGGGT